MGKLDKENRIFFVGRKDLEYKINGQIVAINEVEQAIIETRLFKSVIVSTRKDVSKEPCLIAHVILKEESTVEPAQLRKLLADKLPENSIPTAIVTLSAFPHTEQGKADRKSLPLPQFISGIVEQTDLLANEVVMVSIWEEVLYIRPIGLKSNVLCY